MVQEPDKEPSEPLIELEPLDEKPRQAWLRPSEQAPDPIPVPRRPVHVCPACEYPLVGLTSRRCPECGEPFTLVEARRAGARNSPRYLQDMRALKAGAVSYYAGIAMMVIGLVAPIIYFHYYQRVRQIGYWMSFAASVILILAYLYKGYYQRTWSETMLLAGLMSVTFGGVLFLLFA